VDWVISQTIARRKRELEAEEADYEMRLSAARKREEAIRKMTRAKVTKKPVSERI
jgi:chromosome transmission fidelity protein 1